MDTSLLPVLEQAGLGVVIDYRDFDVGSLPHDNMERFVDASRHVVPSRSSGPPAAATHRFVLAGLISALKTEALPGSEHWTYLGRVVPGVDPLANLEQMVERRWTEGAATTDIPQMRKAVPAALLAMLEERSDASLRDLRSVARIASFQAKGAAERRDAYSIS